MIAGMDGDAILDDTAEEGRRLATAAAAEGLPLVLLGGVAVWVQCPSARVAPLARAYGDADFVGRSADRATITTFLEGQGYLGDKMFNALHGASRLNFTDPTRARPLDVLLDRFAMAHGLDLRDRLALAPPTLPLADLLLTKLQVVSLNEKDLRDIVALLLDHRLAPDAIDVDRILAVTSADWGFERTIHGTLGQVRDRLGAFSRPAAAAALVRARADELEAALAAAPKGRRWKLRARVGDRVRWYEEPEEARA